MEKLCGLNRASHMSEPHADKAASWASQANVWALLCEACLAAMSMSDPYGSRVRIVSLTDR
eukprot:scaffold208068_cov36-Prasinocladus_malaysianus.AAC.1